MAVTWKKLAFETDVVTVAGTQDITGAKTFSTAPVAPSYSIQDSGSITSYAVWNGELYNYHVAIKPSAYGNYVYLLDSSGTALVAVQYATNQIYLTGVGVTCGVLTPTSISATEFYDSVYVPAATTSFTFNRTNGRIQRATTSGNISIALPTPLAGSSYTLQVAYGGAHTVTFTGGGTIKWAGGAAPAATSVAGKYDTYQFYCVDGTYTFGSDGGRNA